MTNIINVNFKDTNPKNKPSGQGTQIYLNTNEEDLIDQPFEKRTIDLRKLIPGLLVNGIPR